MASLAQILAVPTPPLLVTLPAHPITSLPRKGRHLRLDWQTATMEVKITVQVLTYIDIAGELILVSASEPFVLTANNDTVVSPLTLDVLSPDADGQYPEGSMTEYAAYYYAAKNPISLDILIGNAILIAASRGRFD